MSISESDYYPNNLERVEVFASPKLSGFGKRRTVKQKFISQKIRQIMRDWKKTGKIGSSTPKTKTAAQRQAIAVAYSMAERKKFRAEGFEHRIKINYQDFNQPIHQIEMLSDGTAIFYVAPDAHILKKLKKHIVKPLVKKIKKRLAVSDYMFNLKGFTHSQLDDLKWTGRYKLYDITTLKYVNEDGTIADEWREYNYFKDSKGTTFKSYMVEGGVFIGIIYLFYKIYEKLEVS